LVVVVTDLSSAYIDVVLGDRPGFLAVAFGYRPCYDDAGKYRHRKRVERRYRWPSELEELRQDISQLHAACEQVDVYVCPAVRVTDDRRKGSALPPMVCWADLDSEPKDADLLTKLDPFIVESGTTGHRHLYIPLTEQLDLGTWNRVQRALRESFSGDDKIADNDLLRLPGTYNWKATARDPKQCPTPVTALPWSGRAWEPAELLRLLSIDTTSSNTSQQPPAITAEPAPDPLPSRVQAALDHEDTIDRSKAHHRVVGACRDAGLSAGQTLTVVSGYGPSLEKYDARLADEVARSWNAVSPSPAGEGETAPKKAAEKTAGPSQATRLVQLALAQYDLGCTADGEPYAISKTGPRVVRLLRGGRGSLRAELARAYYDLFGTTTSQSALADACMVIEGQAQRIEPVELHLRVAAHREALVLDLGDPTGRAVVITPTGWRVVDEPPVRFRRTAATGALPEPVGGGSLDALWLAVNVAEQYRPLVLAVLVAALIPDLPHPVVALTGEQGSGKSTATRRLASIIDPSPAQLRKAPRDVEAWTTAAAGSWIVALDNLSGMPDWLSDALCRLTNGDGDLRRRLYTDGDLYVIAFRRVAIINGIDLGALRGDLADRLVHIVLDVIAPDQRRLDRDLETGWRQAHPRVLGAVLDLTVKVLAALPGIHLDELPRMADFARVLAAVDQVIDTDGLTTYRGLADDLAQDAVTSDPVLVAITTTIRGEWSGTSAELLYVITKLDDYGRPPKDWPKARALTAILRRQAPALRRLGWTVAELPKDPYARAVRFHLAPPEQRKGENDARVARDARSDPNTPAQPDSGSSSDISSDNGSSSDVARPALDARPDARPHQSPLTSTNGATSSDTSDTSGKPPLSLSADKNSTTPDSSPNYAEGGP
jgi:hypothetical protein